MCEIWKKSVVRNDVDVSIEKKRKANKDIHRTDVQIDRTDKQTDGQTERQTDRQTDRQRWQCSGNEQVEGGADRGGARRGGPRVRGKEVGGRTEKGA